MAKKAAAVLRRQRIERAEATMLELVKHVETEHAQQSAYWARRHLLEKARAYAAAMRLIGGQR